MVKIFLIDYWSDEFMMGMQEGGTNHGEHGVGNYGKNIAQIIKDYKLESFNYSYPWAAFCGQYDERAHPGCLQQNSCVTLVCRKLGLQRLFPLDPSLVSVHLFLHPQHM